MKLLHGRRLWWAFGALAIIAAVLAWVLPLRDWSEGLEQSLEQHTLVVALLIFCAAAVVGTLLMIPAWIFPVAAGAAFGFWWGLLAAVISSALASLAAFLIGRYVLRERIGRRAKRDETFAAVNAAVGREPMKIVALLRMSPVLPSGLKSYFLGLTKIAPIPYALASVAGMLPGNALKTWIGHAGRNAVLGDGPGHWIGLALGIGATVAVTFLVGRTVRKRIGV